MLFKEEKVCTEERDSVINKTKAINSQSQLKRENTVSKLRDRFETEFSIGGSAASGVETYTAQPVTITIVEDINTEANVCQVIYFFYYPFI